MVRPNDRMLVGASLPGLNSMQVQARCWEAGFTRDVLDVLGSDNIESLDPFGDLLKSSWARRKQEITSSPNVDI